MSTRSDILLQRQIPKLMGPIFTALLLSYYLLSLVHLLITFLLDMDELLLFTEFLEVFPQHVGKREGFWKKLNQ